MGHVVFMGHIEYGVQEQIFVLNSELNHLIWYLHLPIDKLI